MRQRGWVVPVVGLALAACSGGGGGSGDVPAARKTLNELAGVVQKGPFINGTPITIAELDSSFVPTGRSFNSSIADNSGSFTLRNVELSSPYVELKADGFYFNEVLGERSHSRSSPCTR